MEFLRADCTSEFSRGQDPIETSPMSASFFELLLRSGRLRAVRNRTGENFQGL
jgi:hypothetical protein